MTSLKKFLQWCCSGMKKYYLYSKEILKSLPVLYYIGFASIVGFLLFLACSLSIYVLYYTVCRYLFPIMPLYYLVFFVTLYYMAKVLVMPMKIMKCIFVGMIVVCAFSSNILFQATFAYQYSIHTGKTMDKLEENSTVIIATESGWLLTTYPFRLLQVGNICVVDLEYLFESENELDALPESSADKPVYLILDTTRLVKEAQVTQGPVEMIRYGYKDMNPEHTYEECMEYFTSLPYVEKCEFVGQDSAYYSELDIYQLR